MPDEAQIQSDEALTDTEPEPEIDSEREIGPEPEIDPGADAEVAAEPEVAFSWQASEFVHNKKSPSWYGVLAVIVVVLAGFAIWLGLWLEIGVFIAMGAAVVVYARKPPRTLLYELSGEGVHIDGKLRPFEDFRSFGVIADEEWHSIDLEPAKRFSPRTALLFNSEDFEQIVSHLELHLPREDREMDIIERITRYVRF